MKSAVIGKVPSWKKLLPIAILFVFGLSSMNNAFAGALFNSLGSIVNHSTNNSTNTTPFTSSAASGGPVIDGTSTAEAAAGTLAIDGSNSAETGSSLAIDGTAVGSASSSTSMTATLTTANSNDVIYLVIGVPDTAQSFTVTDSASLTWTHRDTKTSGSGTSGTEISTWYAIASSPLSSDVVTVTWSTAFNAAMMVFGISGADTSAPFDSNSAIPATSAGSTTAPSVSISTSNANDMILGLVAQRGGTTLTVGSGFSEVTPPSGSLADGEYQVVSTTQSGLSVGFSSNHSYAWAMVGDAIVAASSGGGAKSISTTLSTSSSPDVIYVSVVLGDTGLSVSVTGSLTFTERTCTSSGSGTSGVEVCSFYAIATSTLNAQSITASWSTAVTASIMVFGISGANTASPFDSNSGIPATSSGSSTTPSVSVSTSNANDMILGLVGQAGSDSFTAKSGFNQISRSTVQPSLFSEYEVVSTTQSSLSVSATSDNSNPWAMIGDAIQAAPGVNSISTTLTTKLAPDIIYTVVAVSGTAAGISVSGLSFTERACASDSSGSGIDVCSFYAVVSSTLNSQSITASWSSDRSASITVFGIYGANTLSPFDSNGAIPATSSGSSKTASVIVSTSNSNDMILGLVAQSGSDSFVVESGFSEVVTSTILPSVVAEYNDVSSSQNNLNVSATSDNSNPWAMIGDAVQAFTSGSPAAQGLAYFGMMSKDGTIATGLSNYANWAIYKPSSDSISSSSSSLNIDVGLSENLTVSGSIWSDLGLVNSTALQFGSASATLSFQITSAQEGRVVLAPSYSTTNEIFGTSQYLDFCVCENTPQIKLSSSNALWTDSQQSQYTAWAVTLGQGGVGLTVYLNIGTGWQLAYSNPTLSIGFDYGYLYAFARTYSSGSATFAYLNSWAANNPKAEGTLDQNTWYLIRHYETISAGSYAGDAVILDGSAPPLWMSVPDGSNTAYVYAGMTTNGLGNDCQSAYCSVQQGVLSVQGNTQTDAYLFCFSVSISCSSADLQALEAGSSLSESSATVAYVTVTISPDSSLAGTEDYNVQIVAGTTPFTLHFGTSQIYQDTGLSGTGSYSNPLAYGAPGMRYVSRHVTEITGLLFKELGYGALANNNWSGPLLNFDPAVTAACAGGTDCPSNGVYNEYYSPLFPKVINPTSYSSNWYDTTNAFPGKAFYNDLPDSTSSTFSFPEFGTQFSYPYVSMLSLSSNICIVGNCLSGTTDQGFLNNIEGGSGFYPNSLALEANYLSLTGGSTSQIAQLFSQVNWDGLGISRQVVISGLTGIGLHYTDQESSYGTFGTGSFLSAASAAAVYTGSQQYKVWAQQAAGVLEGILWSGASNIVGQSQPLTLWQFTGGAMADYTPFGAGLGYTSNQGYIYGTASSTLRSMGVQGLQNAESPGYDPVSTEPTAVSAAALYVYISDLPGLSAQPLQNGNYFAANGNALDTTTNCSPNQASCSGISTVVPNEISFNSGSGAVFTGAMNQPITIETPIPSSSIEAGFYISGTVGGGSSLELSVELYNSTGDVTGYSTTLQPSSNTVYNQFVAVSGQFPLTLAPGTYNLQYVVTANGFAQFTSAGYVQALYVSIVPNSINENFPVDPSWSGWWNSYQSPGGQCSTSWNNQTGLVIAADNGGSNPTADCGYVSQSELSAISGSFLITGQTTIYSGALSGTNATILLTPNYLGSSLPSSSDNYMVVGVAGTGTGYEAFFTHCTSGQCSSAQQSSSASSISWIISFNPTTGNYYVMFDGGSGFQVLSSGTQDWGVSSLFTYLIAESATNSQNDASFQGVSVQGTDVPALSTSVTGDMNQFSLSSSSPQVGVAYFDGLNEYLTTSSSGDFNGAQTISFWMNPSVEGTPTSGSGSALLVSDGAYSTNNWWFEYYNSNYGGRVEFWYNLGGTNYGVSTNLPLSTLNIPYFITGVYNPATDLICVYLNAQGPSSCNAASGSPATTNEGLYIGYGGSNGAFGTQYQGYLWGLTISKNAAATQQQVEQMMQQQGGAPIGSYYWYPLEGSAQALNDVLGSGPALVQSGSFNVNLNTKIQSFPYYWSSQQWNAIYGYTGGGGSSGNPYYTAVDSTTGNQPPSLQVYENSASSESCYNTCVGGVLLSSVDTSLWPTSDPLMLTLDYRATSSYSGTSGPTNFNVYIYDTLSAKQLYGNDFSFQNTMDTGWRTFSMNIASYVSGHKNIVIILGITNNWNTNWNQKDWFDNIRVYDPNQSPFYALKLYKWSPSSAGSTVYSLSANGAVEVPGYSPPATAFTISTWFEPFNLTSGSDMRILANDHTDSGTGQNHGFQILYSNGGGFSGTTGIGMDIGSGSATGTVIIPVTLQAGQWYNTIMTYDGNNLCGYVYEQGSGLVGSTCSTIGAGYSLTTGEYPVSIGFNPQYQGAFFTGTVSDVRIYSYAQSSSQVGQVYSNGILSHVLLPNSLWLPLDGTLTDQISGYVGVPYIASSYGNQYVSFAPEG